MIMNFDKFFKVAVLVLFAMAIFVYGMANRYQYFHIANSLTGLINIKGSVNGCHQMKWGKIK
jgi:hypothetical protein